MNTNIDNLHRILADGHKLLQQTNATIASGLHALQEDTRQTAVQSETSSAQLDHWCLRVQSWLNVETIESRLKRRTLHRLRRKDILRLFSLLKMCAQKMTEHILNNYTLHKTFQTHIQQHVDAVGNVANNRDIHVLSRSINDTMQLLKEQSEAIEKQRKIIDLKSDVIEFIANIAPAESVQSVADKPFKDYCALLEDDYLKEFAPNANLPDEAAQYEKLLTLREEMKRIMLAPAVYRRVIGAVTGAFSSGKSTLLNYLIGPKLKLLPTDTLRTTAIPTYITHVKSENVETYIVSKVTDGRKLNTEHDRNKEWLPFITHQFTENYKIALNTLLECVVLSTPSLEAYKKLAFLDTPGYNSGDTDNKIADRSTAGMQFLILCCNCHKGGLTDLDVSFLNKHMEQPEPPELYLVLTRARRHSPSKRKEIMDAVQRAVDKWKWNPAGIGLFDKAGWYEHKGKSLPEFLEEMNRHSPNDTMQRDSDAIWDTYIEHHKKEQKKQETLLGFVKKCSLLMDDADEDTFKTEVRDMKKTIETAITLHADCKIKAEKLKSKTQDIFHEFFSAVENSHHS